MKALKLKLVYNRIQKALFIAVISLLIPISHIDTIWHGFPVGFVRATHTPEASTRYVLMPWNMVGNVLFYVVLLTAFEYFKSRRALK